MPPKRLKFRFGSGREVVVRSIRLANGNLLIPRRRSDDRSQVEWAEVEPGTSDYKRWSTVAEDAPDPREPEEGEYR